MKQEKNNTQILDLSTEMAWVTFMNENWENVWHPVCDINGNQLKWIDSTTIMDYCKLLYNGEQVTMGIAPTSQMIIKNAVRDNI